jgi:hypothetical protein
VRRQWLHSDRTDNDCWPLAVHGASCHGRVGKVERQGAADDHLVYDVGHRFSGPCGDKVQDVPVRGSDRIEARCGLRCGREVGMAFLGQPPVGVDDGVTVGIRGEAEDSELRPQGGGDVLHRLLPFSGHADRGNRFQFALDIMHERAKI